MTKRDQMNLGFDENEYEQIGGVKNPAQIVVNLFPQQSGNHRRNQNTEHDSLGLDSSRFENNPFRIKSKKGRNNEESKLKAFYADHLLELIAKENLNFLLASYKTNISIEKLTDLAKGNISRVSLYQLLSGITTFGCEARICIRPTLHRLPGEVMPDM